MSLRDTERLLFRLNDDKTIPDKEKLFLPTTWREANKWNEKQWGIYWTVNIFKGSVRRNSEIKEFVSWAIDLDTGTKQEQAALIRNFLEPSLVIESKAGFHVYYFAKPDTGIENFKEVMTNHLIPNLNADKSVSDLARVLRAPNFYHWKDVNDPFMVKIKFWSEKKYSEKQIIDGFPPKNDRAKKAIADTKELRSVLRGVGAENLWARIYESDCEAALQKLSGTEAVNGDTFTFQNVSRGRLNIWANGKITASFIDENKRIGSRTDGGPTVWQWVNWYHRDHKKTYRYLKKYLPELFEDEKNDRV